MDPMKAPVGDSVERRCGGDIAIGSTSAFNSGRRPKNQDVRFYAKPFLDTIVGGDEDQAGTMSHTTLDIFMLHVYVGD